MLRSNSTRGKKFAPKSVRMMIGLLGRIINYAIRMDYFEGANPVKKVTLIKDNTRLIRYLEPEEMHRLQSTLVNWPDREVANLVGLILNTGLRRGEVLKLEWNDIDFRNGNLHLREPKGGRDQFIPLSPDALDCLKSQKPYRKRTTNLVFSSSNGKKRTNSDKFWQKIRKAAELPDYFRLHDLRHNFASWLASSGEVDLMTLQALLTHKDPRTTQRYAHLFPNSLRRGANVFSRITQNLGVPDDKRIVSMDERRNA
jgi:integrase